MRGKNLWNRKKRNEYAAAMYKTKEEYERISRTPRTQSGKQQQRSGSKYHSFFLTLKLHEKFMKRIEMAAKKNDDKKKSTKNNSKYVNDGTLYSLGVAVFSSLFEQKKKNSLRFLFYL